jgi:putative SbcD/Mre11-related phosphoesterase
LTQIKAIQPYPAILLQEKKNRTLVVSDIHIGWERLLIHKGVHIPSQTGKIKNLLLKLIKETEPKQLIILGDIKDAITNVSMQERKDISEFFKNTQKNISDIQVVLGNHDGNLDLILPESITIIPATGTNIGDVGLFHGHAWPSPKLLECKSLVSGHIHPTITILDPMGFRMTKQVFIKAPCNSKKLAKSLLKHFGTKTINNVSNVLFESFKVELKVSQLFIMPSFNQFLGGRPINLKKRHIKKTDEFNDPILRSGCVNLDNGEVYLLDGTFLGTVEQLKAIS